MLNLSHIKEMPMKVKNRKPSWALFVKGKTGFTLASNNLCTDTYLFQADI